MYANDNESMHQRCKPRCTCAMHVNNYSMLRTYVCDRHTIVRVATFLICPHFWIIVLKLIGASLSEPHTSDTTYFRLYLSIYLSIYVSMRTLLPPEAPDACAHGS